MRETSEETGLIVAARRVLGGRGAPGHREVRAAAHRPSPGGIASGQTDGLLALPKVQLAPLTAGPTLHVHANEDEMFFVLDGVMTVQIGEQVHDIEAGGLAWGARGIPHAFANRARDPLRIMIMWIPGGADTSVRRFPFRNSRARIRRPVPQASSSTSPPMGSGAIRPESTCLESRKMFSALVRCRYQCSHAAALEGVETSMLVQMKL